MPGLKLQVFIPLADIFLRSFPLPAAFPLAAHNFTRFFKGGKEVKIHHKAALSLFFPASYCTDVSTQVFINNFTFSSSLILFQIRSLSCIALLFSNFQLSQLSASKLFECAVYSQLHAIVRFSISSSLLPFLFH